MHLHLALFLSVSLSPSLSPPQRISIGIEARGREGSRQGEGAWESKRFLIDIVKARFKASLFVDPCALPFLATNGTTYAV